MTLPLLEKNTAMTLLSNGEVFDFSNPDIMQLTPEILGYGLSRIHRWNGHAMIGSRYIHIDPSERMQSNRDVAVTDLHHSFLVFLITQKLWPEDYKLHMQALIHDAGEVLYGDIIGPIKKLLKSVIKPIEHQIESLIAKRYQTDFPWDARIKQADMIAQDIEGFLCFPISVIGVNVEKDTNPSLMDEELFWQAYDLTVEDYIHVLKTADIFK